MIIELVQKFLTHFTYLALIAVLLAAGVGVPIPEDVPLAFSGYLCHKKESPIADILYDADHDGIPETPRRVPNIYLMIVAGMIGVLAGDSTVFFIGRRGIDSNNFVARHIRKVLHSKRREKVEAHFRKHGSWTVFAGRFMPGARSPIFAMAGMSRMTWGRFMMIDGLAAAISVPVFVFVGHHFASRINQLWSMIAEIKEIAIPLFIAAVAIGMALYLLRRRRRRHLVPVLDTGASATGTPSEAGR